MKKKINRDYVTKFIIDNREGYYRLAYTYVKNQPDALDIVQESICKALLSWENLRDPEGLKSWFATIIVRTSLDFLKKSGRLILTEPQIFEEIGGTYNDAYEDTNMDLFESLDRLDHESRTIVLLRFFEDMKLKEIAEIMKMPESTIKTRLYTSLKKMRRDLEKLEVENG